MKKSVALLILLSLILTSCGKSEEVVETSQENVKYITSQEVTQKNFTEELKLTGKISSAKETSISPQVAGTIKTISYKIGDSVKAGDVIAMIDTQTNMGNITLNNAMSAYNNTLNVYNLTKESIQKDLDTAKLQLENAQTTKENTYKTTQKQLELAQAQLDSVNKQKTNTENTVSSSLTLAKESVENSKLNLDNFDKNYDETLKSLETKRKTILDKKAGVLDTLRTTIDSAIASMDTGLSTVDSIVGVTELNKSANDSYEIYLSAKNPSLKTDAENLFRETNGQFKTFRDSYNKNSQEAELLQKYQDLLKMSDKMVTLYDKMTQVLDNSVSTANFTDATLTSLKTTNKTSQTGMLTLKSNLVSLNNSLTDLNNSISDVENTIASTKTSLTTQRATLEQALKISQASLNNTLASTNTSIDSINSTQNTTQIQLENTIESINASRQLADNNLKIAQNTYTSAKAKYDSQLASTKTQLDSANGQKDSASQQIANSQIKAPFDGVITSKNVEIGTLVSAGTQAFGIANSSDKIVKMDVNAENVKYLQVGKDVMVEKDGKTMTGIISVVGASADANTKMYKVEVMLENASTQPVILGDYVDVFVKKEKSEEKYIIVPFSSLVAGNSGNYSVFVVGTGGIAQEKKVKIGLSNAHEVIIQSGLNQGEKVIVTGTLDVQSGDKVQEK